MKISRQYRRTHRSFCFDGVSQILVLARRHFLGLWGFRLSGTTLAPLSLSGSLFLSFSGLLPHNITHYRIFITHHTTKTPQTRLESLSLGCKMITMAERMKVCIILVFQSCSHILIFMLTVLRLCQQTGSSSHIPLGQRRFASASTLPALATSTRASTH